MVDNDDVAVAAPVIRPKKRSQRQTRRAKPKPQPRYSVILWDDPDHSFEYVIDMMQELFGYPRLKGYLIAREVDATGKAICLTTTLEHAELKRDQIHAFGKDFGIERCRGSMSASIEPLPE